MVEKNKISEYITFPRTFENYKWYKPILVFIIALIIYILLNSLITMIFGKVYGWDVIYSIDIGGYEALNTAVGEIYTDLGIIVAIPSIFIASKIVKDRPFSSYSSSRGGWNFKLYFKSLIIPLIMLLIFEVLTLGEAEGTNHFTITFLIAALITVPLQCIAEEYVYRALFMQTFGSWFKIPILAVILQGIIFALSHGYDNLGNIEVFIFGLGTGFLAWKTNGLEVGAALHTANNLFITLTVMFGLEVTSSTTTLTDALIVIAFDILVFIVIYFVGTKTNWFGEIEKPQNET
ncbi:CPBP family intramembrane glutamic endopeptidase [Methanobrevibacter sp.]|uniref:CPBP family intramembrane glutamic endopeptidase n=1 Tax=Methanobrevibacter sp. TaxID=66852 RepID=UPI0038907811